MPSNKASIHDGVIHIRDSVLDLTGTVALSRAANAAGITTILCDGFTGLISVGDIVYTGDLKTRLGKVTSFTTGGSGSIVVDAATPVAIGNDEHICVLPKFEVVGIQALTDTAKLDVLVPCENYYPGTHKSDIVTTWDNDGNEAQYGCPNASAGVVWDASNTSIPGGVIVEGRYKYVEAASSVSLLCLLKSVPNRSLR